MKRFCSFDSVSVSVSCLSVLFPFHSHFSLVISFLHSLFIRPLHSNGLCHFASANCLRLCSVKCAPNRIRFRPVAPIPASAASSTAFMVAPQTGLSRRRRRKMEPMDISISNHRRAQSFPVRNPSWGSLEHRSPNAADVD